MFLQIRIVHNISILAVKGEIPLHLLFSLTVNIFALLHYNNNRPNIEYGDSWLDTSFKSYIMKIDTGLKSWLNSALQTERCVNRSQITGAPHNSPLIKTENRNRDSRAETELTLYPEKHTESGTTGNTRKTSCFSITEEKNKMKKDKTNQCAVLIAIYCLCGVKGNEEESEAVIIMVVICCSVMNAISFLSQPLSARYGVPVSCQKSTC